MIPIVRQISCPRWMSLLDFVATGGHMCFTNTSCYQQTLLLVNHRQKLHRDWVSCKHSENYRMCVYIGYEGCLHWSQQWSWREGDRLYIEPGIPQGCLHWSQQWSWREGDRLYIEPGIPQGYLHWSQQWSWREGDRLYIDPGIPQGYLHWSQQWSWREGDRLYIEPGIPQIPTSPLSRPCLCRISGWSGHAT